MPEWSTACPDWAARLKAGQSIIPPPIFPAEAEAGLAVLRELRIVDAPGSPKVGDACGQWVFDLAASIFGAYDAESGRRLITEWFVMLPKKNFKSGLAASIMLTSLIRNWRLSAEFTVLAPTVEVANNSFGPARDMIQFDGDDEPNELGDLIHVQTHIKTLTHRESGATMKVVATDANTVAGKKSVGSLIEELWLFGKQSGAADMMREALGGLASRPEGFVIYLTTQSDEPPAGVFLQKLNYARDVRDGKIVDPQFLPIIYEFPKEMIDAGEHLDPANFRIVNPNLGYSVDSYFLERELRKAQQEGEESMRGFLAKHLNVQIGLNLRSDRWPGADFWEVSVDTSLTLESLLERSEVVDIGIDGGGLDDLLGLCVLGRERETGLWLAWFHAWAHESVLARRKQEAARLRDFAKSGDLTIVKNVGDDVTAVVEIVVQVVNAGLLDKVGIDQHGVGGILDALIGTDDEPGPITMEQIVGISQGWRLHGAIKTAERRLAGKRLIHAGRPLMAWCVGNAKIVQAGNAVTITKQASGSAKIDPLMALFDAVQLLSLNPVAQGRSFWETA